MTTYTPSLRFPIMTPGDPAVRNTWGTVDNGFIAICETAIVGNGAIPIGGLTSYTLTVSNNVPDQARQALYNFTGALTAACTVTLPAVPKIGWALNATTGGYTVTLTTGSGTTLSVQAGEMAFFSCDGANVISPTFAANNIPPSRIVGEVIAFAGSSAPPLWYLCAGQTVSRSTYSALFSVIGTAYGAGDGSTTFEVPDLRGRAVFGADNMTTAAAGRLTSAGSGVNGALIGASGGSQYLTAHTHSYSDPGHVHGVADPGHAHTINDPGHHHQVPGKFRAVRYSAAAARRRRLPSPLASRSTAPIPAFRSASLTPARRSNGPASARLRTCLPPW
ncbi:MAG TPA: phage tail protein [Rhodopila sp.]|nr:phage tail protein [Rhodopila sp.]